MEKRPDGWWKKKLVKVKAWTVGQKAEPYFPKEYEIITSDILQWSDLLSNHNKYYSIELHKAEEKGKQYFRLYTHYGRTDDLESNRDAGKKETRHYRNLEETEAGYGAIIDEKTRKKGYHKVEMASANIGSEKARARNDSKKEKEPDFASAFLLQQANAPTEAASSLHPLVQELVSYIYSEATSRLTATVSARITERGIETPLGVLNLAQVIKGEGIIDQMASLHADGKLDRAAAEQLSSEFYTVIPHKIGRSKAEVKSAVIMTPEGFDQKRELLQLMKDMLQVNESGGVLSSSAIDNKYKALRCEISSLEHTDPMKFQEVRDYVLNSQVKSRDIEILNIYGLKRDAEHQKFSHNITPQQLLFHGSRISNWVGLLSRGLLMPKSVVSLGGKRTDYGLLGAGLYFGGNSCTSAQYATAGQKGTRFLLLNNVALGRICQVYKITSHLETAPTGYDSVQGVSSRHGTPSDFKDDEFVVYDSNQQRQEYLIEFRSISQDPPAVKSTSTFAAQPMMAPLGAPSPLRKAEAVTPKEASTPAKKPASFFAEIESDDDDFVKVGRSPSPPSKKWAEEAEKEDEAEAEEENEDDDGELDLDNLGMHSISELKKYCEEEMLTVKGTTRQDYITAILDYNREDDDDEDGFMKISPNSPPSFYGEPKQSAEQRPEKTKEREKEKEKEESEPVERRSHAPVGSSSIYADYNNYISHEQAELKCIEDRYREIFATDPHNSELSDPYLGLIDVLANRHTFNFEEETSEEESVPKILDQYRPNMADLQGIPSVVTREKWEKNWADFTGGQLRGMNWANLFVAGGSVLAALDPSFPDINKGNDIDLFIYGLNENDAREKLRHIFNTVQKNTNGKGDIIRTKNAITIIGSFPYHHIQIIMRLYKSPAEVLMGFDIDSCTVGFDGERVWALPRARRAINKRYNLVDLSRRSLTYEVRLNKYAKRGFAVAVPGFNWDRVDPDIYTKGVRSVRGLAKLLVMNHAAQKAAKNGTPKKKSPVKKGKKSANANEEGEESDYNDVEIPWGPEWASTGIVQLLNQRDKAQFFSQIRQNKAKDQHKPVSHIFVSGIDAVLNDTTRMGPLTWLTDNPGRQLLTGSFHPVDDAHWDTDAYTSGSTASISISVSSVAKTPAPAASKGFSFGSSSSSAAPAPSTSNLSSFFGAPSAEKAPAPAASKGFSFRSSSSSTAPVPSTSSLTSVFGVPSSTPFAASSLFSPPTGIAAPTSGFSFNTSAFNAPTANISTSLFGTTTPALTSIPTPKKSHVKRASVEVAKKPAAKKASTKKFGASASEEELSDDEPLPMKTHARKSSGGKAPKKVCSPKKKAAAKKPAPKKPKAAKKAPKFDDSASEELSDGESLPIMKIAARKSSGGKAPRKIPSPKKKAAAKKPTPKMPKTTKKVAAKKSLFGYNSTEELSDEDLPHSKKASPKKAAASMKVFSPKKKAAKPLKFDDDGSASEDNLSDVENEPPTQAFGVSTQPQQLSAQQHLFDYFQRAVATQEIAAPSFAVNTTPAYPADNAATTPATEILTKAFQLDKAPVSSRAKLLLLISVLFKASKLNEKEKSHLKDLTINVDQRLLSALEVFEFGHDFEDLEDTFHRICKCTYSLL